MSVQRPSCRFLRPVRLTLSGLILALGSASVHADALSELRARVLRGDLSGALETAQKAAAADPRDAQARFAVGVVLMDLQRNAEALAQFTRLSQEFPELPDPYNNIALLHVRGNDLGSARMALETALRNDPSHRVARTNLGEVYLLLAQQTWEQLAAQAPLEAALQRRLQGVRSLLATTQR